MSEKTDRYKVEGTLEVIITTHVELPASAMDDEDLWPKRRRQIEAAFRKQVCVESFPGNGGQDKLIGVVGRENAIRTDAKFVPRLLHVQKVM